MSIVQRLRTKKTVMGSLQWTMLTQRNLGFTTTLNIVSYNITVAATSQRGNVYLNDLASSFLSEMVLAWISWVNS
jgi:hypothetical protein